MSRRNGKADFTRARSRRAAASLRQSMDSDSTTELMEGIKFVDPMDGEHLYRLDFMSDKIERLRGHGRSKCSAQRYSRQRTPTLNSNIAREDGQWR